MDLRFSCAVAGAVRHLSLKVAETDNMIVVPMVPNPGTRDLMVLASMFATLNQRFGLRTVCGIRKPV